MFSGSSTSPSSGAAKPNPTSLPLSSKPKGDGRRAEGMAGAARGGGGTLGAAAFAGAAAGPMSGFDASACAALTCGGGALAMRRGAAGVTSAARGLSPLLITMRGGSTGLGSARARFGKRSGTESSGAASSTVGLPNLAALLSRLSSGSSAADLLGGES